MRITFVIPPGKPFLSTNWMSAPPLGISYCAAVLEKQGHQVSIVDAFAEGFDYDELTAKVRSLSPQIVGIYFMTDNRFRGFRTIRKIREALPAVKIIAGGPHVTLAAEDTFKHVLELDYIVRGEGEDTTLYLVRAIEKGVLPEGINGVTYRSDGRIVHNPDAELIQDLDKIPYPAFHLLSLKKYNFHLNVPGKGRVRAMYILSSRGCPFKCVFCANTLLWGNKYRSRSAENVVGEIELDMHEYGLRAFVFADDTFNHSKERVHQICDLLLKRGIKIDWLVQIRVDNVDKELLSKMKRAGCYALNYGVESGRQEIIDKVIKKRISLDHVRRVLAISQEVGLQNYPNFMFSLPGETYEDALETIRLIKKIHRPGVFSILNLLKIYPGTEIEALSRKRGMLPADFSWTDEHFAAKVKDALPSVIGFAPLYREKLSWYQIGRILFQWSESRTDLINIRKVAWDGLKGLRNLNDIMRLLSLGIAFIKVKAAKVRFFNSPQNYDA